MNQLIKSVTYSINNLAGDYVWEVSYYYNVPNEICIVFRDLLDKQSTQYNNMTKAEAVEIARAILKLAGEE